MRKILIALITFSMLIVITPVTKTYAAEGWKQNDTGWWYENADGSYPKNQWKFLDGTWYYFNDAGYRVTNWFKINNTWYYFSNSGAMLTGWRVIDGKLYYFLPSGAMNTKDLYLNNHTYTFNTNGDLKFDQYTLTVGTTQFLSADYFDSNTVKYTTNNQKVVQVTNDRGLMMPISNGTTTIKVTGKVAGTTFTNNYNVTVKPNNNVNVGVDISSWNHDVDYNKLKANGVHFVVLRAGHSEMDSTLVSNVEKASAAGMNIGLYWYVTSKTVEEANKEADNFIQVLDAIGGYKINYPYFLDLESDNIVENVDKSQWASHIQAISEVFVNRLYERKGITNVGIYANTNWLNNYINNTYFASFPIWQAHYNLQTNGPSAIIAGAKIYATYYQTGNKYTIDDNGAEYMDFNYEYVMNRQRWFNNNNQYYDANGNIVKSTWKLIVGQWYYFDQNGYKAKGWKLLNNKWYYFNSNGVMHKGWTKVNGVWYYLSNSGAMLTNTWVGNYYVKNDGSMATNTWIGIYHVNENGVWDKTAGWQKDAKGWWYLNTNGSYPENTWQLINNHWYYFNKSGYMVTGWQYINKHWYYFNESGAMLTGWQKINNVWYYFNASGAMVTGWQLINSRWYYFYNSGAMASNTWIGKYHVNASGAWDSQQ